MDLPIVVVYAFVGKYVKDVDSGLRIAMIMFFFYAPERLKIGSILLKSSIFERR